MSTHRALPFACLVLSVAALLSQLTACGYQLSGHDEDQRRPFSTSLKQVAVEGLGRYEPLRKTLIVHLRRYGIRVVAPSRATARIQFSEFQQQQRRSAVGDDVKAREYLLRLSVSLRVVAAGRRSAVLLSEQRIGAEATYLTAPDRPLLAASAKRTVMKDLEAELCRKIIQRLTTIDR